MVKIFKLSDLDVRGEFSGWSWREKANEASFKSLRPITEAPDAAILEFRGLKYKKIMAFLMVRVWYRFHIFPHRWLQLWGLIVINFISCPFEHSNDRVKMCPKWLNIRKFSTRAGDDDLLRRNLRWRNISLLGKGKSIKSTIPTVFNICIARYFVIVKIFT